MKIFNFKRYGMGRVLLYYKYVSIEYPKHIMKWQKKICQELGLTGRIIIGREGINGTVSGTQKNIVHYKAIMEESALFCGIDFKESDTEAHCFPRLYIVVKDEIVRLGLKPDIIKADGGGKHLSPQESHALIKQNPDNLVIFDIRNKFEWKIGHFKQVLKADINHFRELPYYIDNNLDQFKDKQVLMYCTGGIRCERASTYLKSKKVANQVYQMKGGIHRYVENYPDGFFRGKNYVFDNRIALKVTNNILGTCAHCFTACDQYTNCFNARCNRHFICCRSCLTFLDNTCSSTCHDLITDHKVNKRPPLKKIVPYANKKKDATYPS